MTQQNLNLLYTRVREVNRSLRHLRHYVTSMRPFLNPEGTSESERAASDGLPEGLLP